MRCAIQEKEGNNSRQESNDDQNMSQTLERIGITRKKKVVTYLRQHYRCRREITYGTVLNFV